MLPFATTYRKQTSYRELSKNFWDAVVIMVRAKDTLWALAIWVGQGWWLTSSPAGLSRIGTVSEVSPPSLQLRCFSWAIPAIRNYAFPEGRLPHPELGQHSLGMCFLFSSLSGISSARSFDFRDYQSFVLSIINARPGGKFLSLTSLGGCDFQREALGEQGILTPVIQADSDSVFQHCRCVC